MKTLHSSAATLSEADGWTRMTMVVQTVGPPWSMQLFYIYDLLNTFNFEFKQVLLKGASESCDQLCSPDMFRDSVQGGTSEFSTEASVRPRSAAWPTFQEPGELRTSTSEAVGRRTLLTWYHLTDLVGGASTDTSSPTMAAAPSFRCGRWQETPAVSSAPDVNLWLSF